ncbi:MAG: SCO family protein [Maribacter sp.]
MGFLKNSKHKNLIISLTTIIGLFMVIFYSIGIGNEGLPIYNPTDFNPELVDNSLKQTNNNHTVSDFNLINQNGEMITQKDYENKIYVVDFFFTRCPSICPIMAINMEKLQTTYQDDEEIKLLSISVTPTMDSVPILRDYATKKGAIDTKWNLTTGNKKHIYDLARKSYFAVVDQGDGGLQDFIHTPNFILVDKEKRIRGVYDGTMDDEIERIIQDIALLQKE